MAIVLLIDHIHAVTHVSGSPNRVEARQSGQLLVPGRTQGGVEPPGHGRAVTRHGRAMDAGLISRPRAASLHHESPTPCRPSASGRRAHKTECRGQHRRQTRKCRRQAVVEPTTFEWSVPDEADEPTVRRREASMRSMLAPARVAGGGAVAPGAQVPAGAGGWRAEVAYGQRRGCQRGGAGGGGSCGAGSQTMSIATMATVPVLSSSSLAGLVCFKRKRASSNSDADALRVRSIIFDTRATNSTIPRQVVRGSHWPQSF